MILLRAFPIAPMALIGALTLTGAVAAAQEVGPENGSLVIVGGGPMAPSIYQEFIALAGGRHAAIVYIPTAIGLDDYHRAYQGRIFEGFHEAGATNVRLHHASSREKADSEEFAGVIREAGGVFFGGGRQWRLIDAYAGTKTEEAFWDLLDRGGVIGGSSAGATIQGSYLARGDTKGNMIMMGDHEEGFGFLKNVAIDQHLLRRNRQFDLLEIIEARPELLGIGLDEEAAAIIRGDDLRVIEGYVAIYDAEVMGDRGRFYFLSPGDRLDLATRIATRPESHSEALWLPQLVEPAEVPPDTLLEYVGVYGSEGSEIRISIGDGKLLFEPAERPQRGLVALSENTFFDEATGQKLNFHRDAEGGVESLELSDGRILERTPRALPSN